MIKILTMTDEDQRRTQITNNSDSNDTGDEERKRKERKSRRLNLLPPHLWQVLCVPFNNDHSYGALSSTWCLSGGGQTFSSYLRLQRKH